MQIKYVNRALQRFDSTQVIPTQFVLFTLSVILGSAILYRDFEKKPGDDAGEFVGGCLLTFIGVWLITSGRQDSNGTDSDTDTLENGSGEIATEEGMGKHSELPYGFIRDGSMGDVSSHQVKADRIRTNQEPTGTQASTASETHTSRLGPQMPNEQPSYEWSVSEPSVTVPRLKSAKSADDTVSYELPSQSILRPAKEDQDEIEHPMTDQQHPDPTKSKAARFIPATPPAHGNSLRRPTPDRGGSLARRSFANMVPGPLTSPLSSSLSAVVADSLRRGAEVGLTKHEQLKSRLRAISPTTRYTAHKHMALPDEDAEVEADSPTRPSASRVVPCESTASADAPHSVSCRRQSEHDNDERMHKQLLRPGIRARSLSTTVAGYFRRDRGRARRNDLSNIS